MLCPRLEVSLDPFELGLMSSSKLLNFSIFTSVHFSSVLAVFKTFQYHLGAILCGFMLLKYNVFGTRSLKVVTNNNTVD